ncbi:MAG: hypothetical protein LBH85_07800, partial [Treponema sp.]|nr:hypothetical protein [Treponema sp.]
MPIYFFDGCPLIYRVVGQWAGLYNFSAAAGFTNNFFVKFSFTKKALAPLYWFLPIDSQVFRRAIQMILMTLHARHLHAKHVSRHIQNWAG